MSPTPAPPAPRLLLFPQVGGPEGTDGRPAVRRYSLTLLHDGRRAGRGPRVVVAKPPRL